MAVSIRDVARESGVSIASVSRVLTDQPGVSAETAKRIRKAMAELGYKPNLGARGLVKRRTGNIGICLPKSSSFILGNPFFTKVLEGVAAVVDEADHNLILSFTSKQHQRLFENHAADGVILFAPRTTDLDFEWLKQSDVKVVMIGSSFISEHLQQLDFPAVRPDDRGGIKLAVEELIKLGHQKIALVNGPINSLKSKRCLQGYQEAMTQNDFLQDAQQIIQVDEFEAKLAYQATNAFLDKRTDTTAFVCSADFLAMGVVKAVNQKGFMIPDDVSIVGFGDVMFAEFFIPALSTVRADLEGVGKHAAQILLDMLGGDKRVEQETVFPMQYIQRETTGLAKPYQ